jgi:hypothetical protein
MESVPFPSRSSESISFYEALFFFVLFLFLVVECIWPVMAWRIHHFSTWVPDAAHFYPVRDHRMTIYLTPALGKFYVSLPWLWGSLLAATFLTGLLTSRNPGSRK